MCRTALVICAAALAGCNLAAAVRAPRSADLRLIRGGGSEWRSIR